MTVATGEQTLDDGTFRVTRWTIEPGGSIPFHAHEFDYVVVPLVRGTMVAVAADGTETTVELESGRSYARGAGARHSIDNRTTETVEFVEVEKLS